MTYMDSIEAPVVVGMSNYISILHVEKSGSPGLTPTSVFHQDTVESTCVSAQFLQTPTQYQLPRYRIVSTRPQFTPCLHLTLLPYDTASVDQESTIKHTPDYCVLTATIKFLLSAHCIV